MQGRALLFGALMAVAATARAQGIISFDDVPIGGEPTIEVNMGPEMLSLFGEAAKGAAGQANALEGVTNVRVLVYENIAEDMQDVIRFVDATGTKLEGDGWHAVVRIREAGEQVRVYMKPGASGLLAGVTVMLTDDGADGGGGREAMFINVAGAIQPAQLGQIASTVGMNGVFNGMPGLPAQGTGAKGPQE
jgi:hypothetical protein